MFFKIPHNFTPHNFVTRGDLSHIYLEKLLINNKDLEGITTLLNAIFIKKIGKKSSIKILPVELIRMAKSFLY